jgi:hypothetical protein
MNKNLSAVRAVGIAPKPAPIRGSGSFGKLRCNMQVHQSLPFKLIDTPEIIFAERLSIH